MRELEQGLRPSLESVFACLCHCASTLIEVCGVHPCTMLKNRHPWSLASCDSWISVQNFENIIGRKFFDLTNMEDPYNLILTLWWRWMESSSCSLPRLHWCGEGYHSTCPFLALLLIHSGRSIEFEKFLQLTHTLFEGRLTPICISSNFFRPLLRLLALCQDYIGVVKLITPLVHLLHFPQSVPAELFNLKKNFPTPTPYFEVSRLEFT